MIKQLLGRSKKYRPVILVAEDDLDVVGKLEIISLSKFNLVTLSTNSETKLQTRFRQSEASIFYSIRVVFPGSFCLGGCACAI